MSATVSSTGKVATLDRLTDSVLFISASLNGRHVPFGSGVVVGPFLGMTALHVLEGIYREFQGEEINHSYFFGTKYPDPKFEIMAWCADREAGIQRRFWVRAFSGSMFSDIAVLLLQPMPDDQLGWPMVPIRLSEPPVDTDVHVYGWIPRVVTHGLPSEEHDESKEEFRLTLNYLHPSIRKVHELSAKQASAAKFPCLEVNCVFEHQMSGGPVFGPDLWLCGIVSCSSDYHLREESGRDEPRSFAATMLPIIGSQISYKFPNDRQFAEYGIKEIAERGFMRIQGVERTSLTRDEDGRVTDIHWHPPKSQG